LYFFAILLLLFSVINWGLALLLQIQPPLDKAAALGSGKLDMALKRIVDKLPVRLRSWSAMQTIKIIEHNYVLRPLDQFNSLRVQRVPKQYVI